MGAVGGAEGEGGVDELIGEDRGVDGEGTGGVEGEGLAIGATGADGISGGGAGIEEDRANGDAGAEIDDEVAIAVVVEGGGLVGLATGDGLGIGSPVGSGRPEGIGEA